MGAKYLRRGKVSGSAAATEVSKGITSETQVPAPDAGSTLQTKKRVRINPEAMTVPLGQISKPGSGDGAARVPSSPTKQTGTKTTAERAASSKPSPTVAEVVNPGAKVVSLEQGAELLLKKYSHVELYEHFGASLKVCLPSCPRVPSRCY